MNRYLPFRNFIFRTPCFPLFGEDDKNSEFTIFAEALFLASSDLYEQWLRRGHLSVKEKQKLEITSYKYRSRAKSRPTPFGLFAGCSIGEWGEQTKIQLKELKDYKRCTRLDMNYLCALIQYLEKLPEIRSQLLYYSNDSIYRLGGQLRYVEYYYKGSHRVHQITSVENSDYLQKILTMTSGGVSVTKLIALLVKEENVSYEEAEVFIMELINAQLLKSELEPSVTGDDPLNVLCNKLGKLERVDEIHERILKIKTLLSEIDNKPIGETLCSYNSIIENIKKIGVEYNSKFLFQTDLFKPVKYAFMSKKLVNDIDALICFLNKITDSQERTNLKTFKEVFYNRYGDAEIPLTYVLDKDLGIGYPIKEGDTGDINPLIDDIGFPVRKIRQQDRVNSIQSILLKKYIEAFQKGESEIILSDADFPDKRPYWDDLPDTIYVMCSFVAGGKGENLIFLKSLGGSSAGNLLARFCHLDNSIFSLLNEITDKEKEMNPNYLIAEIVHLPEARVGNILSRPAFREYEIPYLTQAGVEHEKQINLSDLTVSIKNDRIVLKSIQYNKEVIPKQTTAHNYSNNSMPIYHFLCDLQLQNKRGALYCKWGSLENDFDYLPRIRYRNWILKRQQWRISCERIKGFEKYDDAMLLKEFTLLCETLKMPRKLLLPDFDNELLIDVNNVVSIRALLAQVKKQPNFVLKEFLDNEENVVTPGFVNEFIFPFYRNVKNE